MNSVIDPELLQAYRETAYRVCVPEAFELHVGCYSPELAHLHRRYRVESSAFVTAWNPYSKEVAPEENRRRNESLERELVARSVLYIAGIGQHPSNGWAGEESLLVLGVDLETARQLGQRYEQNAIVWVDAAACPSLVVLR